MKDMQDILSTKYPKIRCPLSVKQQEIYETEYLLNREGRSFMSYLSQKLESWMHVMVVKHIEGSRLLEVGAGTLNHLQYINLKNIDFYDVVEPADFLYDNSVFKKRINSFFSDINECYDKYDSIFSIAVLEHVTNLPEVIAKSGLLLKDKGVMVSAIPCEGGLLWGVAWRISTGLAYKIRTGLSYKDIMRYEHVNNYSEIIEIVKYFFRDVTIKFFPVFGKHLSLYACVISRNPNIQRCKSFASSQKISEE